jgi:hypothetical protein
MAVLPIASAQATGVTCDISYNLPGEIGDFGNDPPDQANLDAYSWQSFLALNAPAVGQSVSTTGDNRTLWGGSVATPISSGTPGWSSTVDLLEAATTAGAPAYGTHYYPAACTKVQGYQNYRVIDELSKVDDGFFEAEKQGLSASPVVATNGTFLRYEILISEVTYDTIVDNKWYLSSVLNGLTESLNFPCGTFKAGGSKASPSDPGIGAITIKNAWMEAGGLDASNYHMEKLLIYTPAAQNASGRDTCELETMALVGQHIAHKTTLQSAWTWSTFEHAANGPDCTTTPPAMISSMKNIPSTGCPSTGGPYNFFPQNTSDTRFASCNATPATNGTSACDKSYCADQAPNPVGGYSRLCRQLALQANYPQAYDQTQACNQATGSSSVWSNYALISTQWFTGFSSSQKSTCANDASTVAPPGAIDEYAPQVTLKSSDGTRTVPYLANTSMESYERSNCMGCHTNALVNKNSKISTDLMYFMMLEVPAAPVNQD